MITAAQIPELARKAGASAVVRPGGTVGYFPPSDFEGFLVRLANEAIALNQKESDDNRPTTIQEG